MARNFDAEKQKIIDDFMARGASKYQATQLAQEQIDQAKMQGTSYDGIQEDEASISAQREASDRYKEMADNGGFTAADRAALNASSKRVGQQSNARRLNILNEMQQRGTAGGGSELAARLAGADSDASVAADQAGEIAARGEAKRDNAIAARGQLAGQMRNQSYQVQSDRANARDGVARFNSDLQGRSMLQNNNNTNEASRYNAGADERQNTNATSMQYNSVTEAQRIQLEKEAAKKARKSGQGAAIGGVIGTAAGAYFGGPAGAAAGGAAGSALGGSMYAHGGKVEGEAKVEGDSYENDVVPALVSPGEIIVPRSKVNDPDAAKEFVAKHNDVEGDEENEMSIEDAVLSIAKALAALKGK